MKKGTKAADNGAKTGIELIADERKQQLKKHDYTVDFDVRFNTEGQLVQAVRELTDENPPYNAPFGWECPLWDKMRQKPLRERLIIAGALLAAEIDRLDAVAE